MWTRRFPLQNTAGTDAGGGGGAPKGDEQKPPAGGAPAVDAAELGRLRESEKRLQQLEAAQATESKKRKDAEAQAAKDLEAKGELAKALEAQKKLNEELSPLSEAGKKWQAHEAAELKRIEEAAAKLPEAAQKAIAAANGLEAKQAFLSAFSTAGGAPPKPEHKPPNSPGAGAPTTKVDFGTITERDVLRTAKAADPEGWEAYKASLRGTSTKPLTTFERRRLAQTKKG